ncbi:Protein adenylyltransferase SelO, mitochondrial [Lamellibrachia satsuma]|nr:Protein adenylyltransferase SelO, mitochondrial [Lamellibrachia satsuma]
MEVNSSVTLTSGMEVNSSVTLQAWREIFSTFLTTMEQTGADFTNCFRALSTLPLPESCQDLDLDLTHVLTYMLSQCSSAEELQQAVKPRLNPGELQMMMMLAQMDPAILEQFRAGSNLIAKELERMKKSEELQGLTEEKKQMQDESLWKDWLNKYVDRLQKEVDGEMTETSLKAKNETRVHLMNHNNPKYILRNYIAQNAIDAAEEGDFSEVNRVLKLLSTPYDDTVEIPLDTTSILHEGSTLLAEATLNSSKSPSSTRISYDGKPPACSKGFKKTTKPEVFGDVKRRVNDVIITIHQMAHEIVLDADGTF